MHLSYWKNYQVKINAVLGIIPEIDHIKEKGKSLLQIKVKSYKNPVLGFRKFKTAVLLVRPVRDRFIFFGCLSAETNLQVKGGRQAIAIGERSPFTSSE